MVRLCINCMVLHRRKFIFRIEILWKKWVTGWCEKFSGLLEDPCFGESSHPDRVSKSVRVVTIITSFSEVFSVRVVLIIGITQWVGLIYQVEQHSLSQKAETVWSLSWRQLHGSGESWLDTKYQKIQDFLQSLESLFQNCSYCSKLELFLEFQKPDGLIVVKGRCKQQYEVVMRREFLSKKCLSQQLIFVSVPSTFGSLQWFKSKTIRKD